MTMVSAVWTIWMHQVTGTFHAPRSTTNDKVESAIEGGIGATLKRHQSGKSVYIENQLLYCASGQSPSLNA